jgi:RNA polymerase sigma-70 factor (ECF subfamily)
MAMVMRALYLLFNEGYSATVGDDAIQRDLCLQAMALTQLLRRRFPDNPALSALLALMCLHAARFDSRVDGHGQLVLFEEQDRSAWDPDLIAQGIRCLAESARGETLSTYHLEASALAAYCTAPRFEETNWAFVMELYEQLYAATGNPVVALNLGIVALHTVGLEAAIERVEKLAATGALRDYPPLYAALGELYAQRGDVVGALRELGTALELSPSPNERVLLREKIAKLGGSS